jgi:hypothetical protein
VDVLTAPEDGTEQWEDPRLLDRSGELGRVLFSQDEDLLIVAARRQREGIHFAGVNYAPQLELSVGQFVEELEVLAKVLLPAGSVNRVQYLPMR